MTKILAATNLPAIALTLALAALAACEPQPVQPTVQTPALAAEPSPTTAVGPQSNAAFTTITRVEYVMQCMQEHGGQNYDNLYHCACAIDTIAQTMTPDEYDQAVTFTNLFGMAGERGSVFRDPPQSEQLRKKLKDAKAKANESCFPKSPGTANGSKHD
ncbi:MAG: hypothetical protein PHT19_15225 [Methylococcus sp.]|nr:hypothetical protein [Methylococcus sp.]